MLGHLDGGGRNAAILPVGTAQAGEHQFRCEAQGFRRSERLPAGVSRFEGTV